MNIEEIRSYCLSKRGVTEDCAFGPDTILFRLCGKIFSCIDLHRPHLVVLKSNEDEAIELRSRYQGIIGAWHWNKRYWSEVGLDSDVPTEVIYGLLDRSYELVRSQLPQKTLYHFSGLPVGWKHEHFPVLDSAMNMIRTYPCALDPDLSLLVTTDFQTSGRGQGTNTWESENLQNLLFAFRFTPQKVKAVDQFGLLQCVSLAVAKAVQKFYPNKVKIKWPNDIYCEDKKICGILIEHDLCGQYLTTTRCGIGINVNQSAFYSSAPNPVSLRQLLGKEVNRAAVLKYFLQYFQQELHRYYQGASPEVAAEYTRMLYRLKGWYPYRDATGEFDAKILGVAHDGRFQLVDRTGQIRTYAHKEVEFIGRHRVAQKGIEE